MNVHFLLFSPAFSYDFNLIKLFVSHTKFVNFSHTFIWKIVNLEMKNKGKLEKVCISKSDCEHCIS